MVKRSDKEGTQREEEAGDQDRSGIWIESRMRLMPLCRVCDVPPR